MSKASLSLQKRGDIAYVTLCRPESQNAIDGVFLRELADACQAVEADDSVRVLLLTADGDVFSSGWDWSALGGLAAEAEGGSLLEAARAQGMLDDPFGCLTELPQPVVCALSGNAIGAGLELALACDLRLASESARFGLPETAMGMLPMGGGTQRLARLVGRGKALEMILAGDTIDAREALRVGLASAVAHGDRLLAEAESIAHRIAERGPLAVRYAKEAVSRGIDMPLEQALRYETDLTVILQTTEDRAEGVRAFLEKRKPEFKGA